MSVSGQSAGWSAFCYKLCPLQIVRMHSVTARAQTVCRSPRLSQMCANQLVECGLMQILKDETQPCLHSCRRVS